MTTLDMDDPMANPVLPKIGEEGYGSGSASLRSQPPMSFKETGRSCKVRNWSSGMGGRSGGSTTGSQASQTEILGGKDLTRLDGLVKGEFSLFAATF